MQSEVPAPRILLTATLRWPIAARLAMAFVKRGCQVAVICPPGHPVLRTHAIVHSSRYPVIAPLAGLRAAIESFAPDLIVPCDDAAAVHLQQLHARTGTAAPDALRTLIALSLGAPDACLLATRRGSLMALAREEGIRTPAGAVIGTAAALAGWLEQYGFPAVLKVDGSWGGQGVAVVADMAAAQRAFSEMTSRPRLASTVARLLLDRDPRTFLASLKSAARTVTVQQFIAGTPANRAVACWQGKVLAGISVEALRTQHPTGPATVVRAFHSPQMFEAVAQLVRRLGISGLWGADFVLEASSGAAYLVEVNPRATPICHLQLGVGRNLPAALLGALRAGALPVPPVPYGTIESDVIAMFPGEWQRDPASSHLRMDYHDVPWDEPQLVHDGIDGPWSERGLLARARARWRHEPRGARVRSGP